MESPRGYRPEESVLKQGPKNDYLGFKTSVVWGGSPEDDTSSFIEIRFFIRNTGLRALPNRLYVQVFRREHHPFLKSLIRTGAASKKGDVARTATF
ncbi:MAG: hypothetical protein ACFFFG_07750 [Candidatus Thorarchaeota archaeon]